jgi:CBS domain-containing protein
MTRTPKTAAPDELGAVAVHRMETYGIMALPVVGETEGWSASYTSTTSCGRGRMNASMRVLGDARARVLAAAAPNLPRRPIADSSPARYGSGQHHLRHVQLPHHERDQGGLVRADTAYMYVDSAHVDLRVLTIEFNDEDGRPRATVTGRTGEWDQERDIMVARGDVLLVVHADQREIRTEELHYDAYNERIWSDSATVQTLPDGTVTRGSSFESDLGFQDLRIENVRGGARGTP